MKKNDIFYLAACSECERGGIYRYRLAENGEPIRLGFTPLHNSNYLVVVPETGMLYSTGTDDDGAGIIAAYRIGTAGALHPAGKVRTAGDGAFCHLAVSPERRRLAAAAYAKGYFEEFRLDSDGLLSEASPKLVRHHGHGPDPKRQEGPHPHFCAYTPDGGYLVVIDLGVDTVFCYPHDPERGIDPERPKQNRVSPPGAGPRHLVFARNGRAGWLLNEMGNSVQSFRYADGVLTPVGLISTLPRGVRGATKAAAIRVSEDERFLYATNRGFDSVAVFAIGERGMLGWADLVLSGGSSPRDFNLLPGGSAAATNEFSDSVFFFDVDGKTGALTPNGWRLELPRPLCAIPLE